MKIREAYRISHRQDQKRNSPHHVVVITLNVKNKGKILKGVREKDEFSWKSKATRTTADFFKRNHECQRGLDQCYEKTRDARLGYYAQQNYQSWPGGGGGGSSSGGGGARL